ncbi:MAG: DegT/DnrJ/EryC1/StrS family aminotransferase [Myxococcota bacterium]
MTDTLAILGGSPVRTRPWAAWPEWGDPEREALERVLASGSWGGHPSPNTEARAFTSELAAYLGTEHVVACANGTFALTLALQSARIGPGAEVVTTGYSFVGTASAIIAAGCVPIFVDVRPETYCIDPDAVEAAVGPRTEAVLPVHLGSQMADMDALRALTARRGLLLVEDCAHAHGARWRGRGAGTLCDLGAFSMQTTKLLTGGEGGAVATRDATMAERLLSLVNCGRKEPEYRSFPEQMLGHNLRMTEWQAAILRAQLLRLPEQHARRARNVARFVERIASVPGVEPLPRDPRVELGIHYQLVLRYDAAHFAGLPRDRALEALRAEGVPCAGRFYRPLPDDPLFARDPHTNPAARAGARWSSDGLPVTRRAAEEEALWLHHALFLGDDRDVEDLVSAFARVQARASSLREAGVA